MDSQEIIQERIARMRTDFFPYFFAPPIPSSDPVLSHSFFRDYALLLISGRGKAGSTGDESHLRTI